MEPLQKQQERSPFRYLYKNYIPKRGFILYSYTRSQQILTVTQPMEKIYKSFTLCLVYPSVYMGKVPELQHSEGPCVPLVRH